MEGGVSPITGVLLRTKRMGARPLGYSVPIKSKPGECRSRSDSGNG